VGVAQGGSFYLVSKGHALETIGFIQIHRKGKYLNTLGNYNIYILISGNLQIKN
jgi:hypothetical protein